MEEDDYRRRVKLALDGLVPIAFLELMSACIREGAAEELLDPTNLVPDETERAKLVEDLVMADVLAAGGARTPREREARGKSLAALAKAIVALACCPGGVKFMGTRYEVVKKAHGLALDQREET